MITILDDLQSSYYSAKIKINDSCFFRDRYTKVVSSAIKYMNTVNNNSIIM